MLKLSDFVRLLKPWSLSRGSGLMARVFLESDELVMAASRRAVHGRLAAGEYANSAASALALELAGLVGDRLLVARGTLRRPADQTEAAHLVLRERARQY